MSSPLSIHVSKGGKTFHAELSRDAVLLDLLLACQDSPDWLGPTTPILDWAKAKFIAKGRTLRAGAHDDEPIAHLDGAKVLLQVPSAQALQDLQASSDAAKAREARVAAHRRAAVPARATTAARRSQADDKYTFLRIEPLPGLRNPERSREFLVRLAEDPGIKAAMRKHEFTVGLLTEMDPLSNTQASHEGTTRLLGLNRNRGEVIELRLRTDAYDGYRDYRTIRDTLCHELAHNVHGPHDRAFWDLCRQIEREVRAADWKHGGQSVAGRDQVFYEPGPDDEDDVPDHGGWTGGTYVLGQSEAGPPAGSSGSSSGNSSSNAPGGPSRRDVIARAAEERLKRLQRPGDPPSQPPPPGSPGDNNSGANNGEGSSSTS